MNTTVSVENKSPKKWEPNREGSKFSEWLKSKKQSNKNINESDISEQASIILSKCIDPNNQTHSNLDSTGLVIGQVQSGKTLSMTSVTAMAKDNGFGIVIIMSGSVSPLSFQTAGRITAELKGRRMYRIINNPKDPWRSEQYSSTLRTFSENFKDKNFPEDRKKTLLIVTHKNPARIRMLTSLFQDESSNIKDIPTLIIDDECDHHSLNSKDYQNEVKNLSEKQRNRLDEIYQISEGDTWESISETYATSEEYLKDINNFEDDKLPPPGTYILLRELETATFREINNLRSIFSFHTYLGYTATPQALTVIDQINNLKPSFVHLLPPGKGYTGLEHFFPREEKSFKHKNNFHINSIEEDLNDIISNNTRPKSLENAVITFIISVASGLANKEDEEEDSNRSMIIHPHSEVKDHFTFYNYTKGILDEIKNGLKADKKDSAYIETVEILKSTYENYNKKNSPKNLPEFNDSFLSFIKIAISETQLFEFNASERNKRIPEIKWDELYSAILVGGVGLERGYTVNGLTISYLSRKVGGKQQDTLLQRARFFGYHENYESFIQIYLSDNLQKYYREISEINKNFINSVNDFTTNHPEKSFKDWPGIWFGSGVAKHELTRKGIIRSKTLFRYKAEEPIVNKFSHLLKKNDLINNYKIYLKLEQTLKDSLVPISEMDDIEPVYKEWAKNRKDILISKKLNISDLYDYFYKDLKFHNFEWKDFLLASLNFKGYSEDERKEINQRICPIIFMNYQSENSEDRTRSNLKGSSAINPHSGKNKKYNKENKETYNLFPGAREIHYDFLRGATTPTKGKSIGLEYPTLQIYLYNVNCKGTVTETVPYFNVYPALNLWRDLLKVN